MPPKPVSRKLLDNSTVLLQESPFPLLRAPPKERPFPHTHRLRALQGRPLRPHPPSFPAPLPLLALSLASPWSLPRPLPLLHIPVWPPRYARCIASQRPRPLFLPRASPDEYSPWIQRRPRRRLPRLAYPPLPSPRPSLKPPSPTAAAPRSVRTAFSPASASPPSLLSPLPSSRSSPRPPSPTAAAPTSVRTAFSPASASPPSLLSPLPSPRPSPRPPSPTADAPPSVRTGRTRPHPASTPLRLCTVNLNSLTAKRDLLSVFLWVNKIDIVLCQETKAGRTTQDSDLAIAGYKLFRKDRSTQRGGLATYIAEGLQAAPERLSHLPRSTEMQLLAIRAPTQDPIFIANCYRSPNMLVAERAEWEDGVVQSLAEVPAGLPLFFFGDTNLDPRIPTENTLSVSLSALGLANLNTTLAPTHRRRLIDYAWGRGHGAADYKALPPLERGDGHAAVIVDLDLPVLSRRKIRRGGGRQWRKADWPEARQLTRYDRRGEPSPFNNRVRHFDTAEGISTSDLVEDFVRAVSEILDQVVPRSRTYYVRLSSPPWLTSRILALGDEVRYSWGIMRRAKAEASIDNSMAAKHRLAAACTRYNRKREKKNGAIKDAKDAWTRRVIEEGFDGGRPWDAIRRLSGRRSTLGPLRLPCGTWLSSDQSKANALAQAFKDDFTPSTTYTHIPAPCPKDHLITPHQAAVYMRKLPRGKSPGLNGISTTALKEMSSELSPVLAELINHVMTSQTVPPSWSTSLVVAVEKKPGAVSPREFRPISLLNAETRILEAHLLHLLEPYLEVNERQFGFRKRSGCGDAIMRALRDVLEVADSSLPVQVGLVLLDTKRAFDSTPTSTILSALECRGTPPNLVTTLESWIAGRELQVRVGSHLSSPFVATSGVPQGSRVGPALFNVAYDPVLSVPLPHGIRRVLYCDDILVVGSVRNRCEQEALQQGVHLIEAELHRLGLNLNPAKSQLLTVSLANSSSSSGLPSMRLELLDGSLVPEVGEARYLGVLFDSRLSFSRHWVAECTRIKSLIGALARLCPCNRGLLRIATTSLVVGRLQHALPFAAPTREAEWHRLHMAIGFASRRLLNDWERDPENEHRYVRGADVVIQNAGYTPPFVLAQTQGLRFLYQCIYGGRAYGTWVDRAQADPRTRRGTRQRSNVGHPELELPRVRRDRLRQLQPYRLLCWWADLRWEAVNVQQALSSLPAFTAALPTLLSTPPPSQ